VVAQVLAASSCTAVCMAIGGRDCCDGGPPSPVVDGVGGAQGPQVPLLACMGFVMLRAAFGSLPTRFGGFSWTTASLLL